MDYVEPLEPSLMEEVRRIAGENAPQPPEKSTRPSGSRVTHAILGEGTVDETDYKINGNYRIGLNTARTFATQYTSFSCNLVGIEALEAEDESTEDTENTEDEETGTADAES